MANVQTIKVCDNGVLWLTYGLKYGTVTFILPQPMGVYVRVP